MYSVKIRNVIIYQDNLSNCLDYVRAYKLHNTVITYNAISNRSTNFGVAIVAMLTILAIILGA